MRILHLLSSSKYGGAEKVAIDIITSVEQNNEIIYASLEGEIEEILEDKGVNYELFKKITIKKINYLLKLYNIDIIHAHDFKASLIASLFYKRVRVISHIHQCPTWLDDTLDFKFIVYRLNAHKFSTILLASESIFNTKLFSKMKNTKILENYVSVEFNNKLKRKKKYDFIFVGRLEKDKNPFLFLEIVEKIQKRNNNVSCLILGSGSLNKEIKERIKIKKLNIEMFGFVKKPGYYMSQSKFIINTSIREGFGIASIEAMQLGIPLITYENGGISQMIIDEENGLVIRENKINLDKILSFLYDEKKYNVLSKNAKLTGEVFNDKTKWLNNILGEYDAIEKKI